MSIPRVGNSGKPHNDRRIALLAPLLLLTLLAGCAAPAPLQTATPTPELTPQPLESGLKFTLQERSGEFMLELHSETIYPCRDDRLVSAVQQQDNQLRVTILGRLPASNCRAAPGPAWGVVELGALSGRWQLTLTHGSLQDTYELALDDEQARLTPARVSFTHILFPLLRRLPPEAFWLVVFRPLDPPGDDYLVTDHQEYQQAAAAFFAAVADLGARPYEPQAEPYSNIHFLPATPMHGRVNDPAVLVPVGGDGQVRPFLLLNWSQVRYFTHAEAATLLPQIARALLDSQPQGELLQAALFLPDGSVHALPRRH